MREFWWFLVMVATPLAGLATIWLDLGAFQIPVCLLVSLSGPTAYCLGVLLPERSHGLK